MKPEPTYAPAKPGMMCGECGKPAAVCVLAWGVHLHYCATCYTAGREKDEPTVRAIIRREYA